MLFENKAREGTQGKLRTEREFEYLDRSARIEASRIRDLLNDWFTHFPQGGRADLEARLKSTDDTNHRGAFWELMLHHWLLLMQCQDLIVHPPITGRNQSPDFHGTLPDGTEFYLEATLATGRPNETQGSIRREREILDTIDRMQVDDFLLIVHRSGLPTQNVSQNQVRGEIGRWLNGLDYEEVVRQVEQPGSLGPRQEFQYQGLTLEIEAQPRHRERRGLGRRTIGMASLRIPTNPASSIRTAIQNKATKYGTLNKPYIIAVNALGNLVRDNHYFDAVFGEENEFLVDRATGHATIRRSGNGALRRNGRPVNTRVSAVIFGHDLSPWRLGQRNLKIIHNPWASHPLPDNAFDMPSWREGALRFGESANFQELLGIWTDWPEGARPPN